MEYFDDGAMGEEEAARSFDGLAALADCKIYDVVAVAEAFAVREKETPEGVVTTAPWEVPGRDSDASSVGCRSRSFCVINPGAATPPLDVVDGNGPATS